MKASMIKALNDITTMEELTELIEFINMKQKSLKSEVRAKVKASVKVGSRVKVNAPGKVMTGRVLEMKRTKAIVEDLNGSRWNCPITMLQAL